MTLEERYQLPPRLHRRRAPIGELELNIARAGSRSIAATQHHQGALRVIRPHYLDDSGQVCYTIVNPGGGYLGGDDYRLTVTVDTDAAVLLTTQSATRVYKTPGDHALQETSIILGPNAVFEYLPDQLILYQGATYEQHTNVSMDGSASFLATEIITPGWAPDGTTFSYDEARVRTAVNVDNRLAVVENLLVRPGDNAFARTSLVFLEGRSHLATMLIIDRRIDPECLTEIRALIETFATQEATTEILWAATLVDGPGLAVRAIGTYTEDLHHLQLRVTDHLRQAWRGQGPVHLRKY